MKKALLILVLPFLQSCATIGMLPDDVSKIDFESEEGKTGWSEYQQVETFYGYNAEQIYSAAKIGLGNSGFSLRKANKSKGFVIGEHGMTAHDWNIIAAVYFLEVGETTKVKIIAEGSKDIGLSGDVTSDGWTGKILKGMRLHLNDTYQTILKVNKSDIK
ncbi:hypothetical protein A9Q81_20660 [Gammaproteobacteria bacterium 42_54_T18]|nr:hypothetical protein A9Q81_20660 [Gammaproteobacteria bacterium 42_54_T18]